MAQPAKLIYSEHGIDYEFICDEDKLVIHATRQDSYAEWAIQIIPEYIKCFMDYTCRQIFQMISDYANKQLDESVKITFQPETNSQLEIVIMIKMPYMNEKRLRIPFSPVAIDPATKNAKEMEHKCRMLEKNVEVLTQKVTALESHVAKLQAPPEDPLELVKDKDVITLEDMVHLVTHQKISHKDIIRLLHQKKFETTAFQWLVTNGHIRYFALMKFLYEHYDSIPVDVFKWLYLEGHINDSQIILIFAKRNRMSYNDMFNYVLCRYSTYY